MQFLIANAMDGRGNRWLRLDFVILLIQIRAPVGQVKDGKDQWEDDARDDVDTFGT